jgi:hypothetical protein
LVTTTTTTTTMDLILLQVVLMVVFHMDAKAVIKVVDHSRTPCYHHHQFSRAGLILQ